MKEHPLVSIVTPSYNQGRFIEATIKSVLEQDYPNLEYIVVDGGSTDNTLDILHKYSEKLKWVSEKDNGQSDAINKGFKMARGEIVAWLNSDDTYEPGAIQAAVDYFQKHKNVALVYGEGDIIDESGNKVKRFDATQDFDLWTLIHVWDYILQPTTFFKLDALQEVGYLDVNLHWCMDWDLWIRIALKHRVGYINRVMANSREYADTKTSTGGWKRFDEIVSVMRKYGTMKYPPGYFLYGASTLFTEYGGTKVGKIIFGKLMHYIHSYTFRNLPVKYKDNWVGKTFSFCVPIGISHVEITGDAIVSANLPITLKIEINGSLYQTITIRDLGTFSCEIKLNDTHGLNVITVKSDRTFVPAKLGSSHDQRKLAFVINDIVIK
jgi:glycosyltransferase involved in cell wall biosynthesis